LQDCAIQRQIGDDVFELGVLFAQLPQFTDLGRSKLAKALLPDVEGRLGDTELRVISAIGVPSSACRSAAAICSSE